MRRLLLAALLPESLQPRADRIVRYFQVRDQRGRELAAHEALEVGVAGDGRGDADDERLKALKKKRQLARAVLAVPVKSDVTTLSKI